MVQSKLCQLFITFDNSGVFILWLGWFGFNGGSQLALGSGADATAVADIFVNTNLAAAGGVLACMIVVKLLIVILTLQQL